MNTEELTRLRDFLSADTAELYDNAEFRKKAAVCLILFTDKDGDLSLVMTVRSTKLRTYPGQAALPGGRCDRLEEDAWATALREAYEEIGFEPSKFNLTKLCMLPCYLSRHFLIVRPCVLYIEPKDNSQVINLQDIAPRINESEVQAVYSVKLRRFLSNESPLFGEATESNWAGNKWVYMEFGVQRTDPETQWVYVPSIPPNYKANLITGLTAHMVVDCARVAYNVEPTGFPFAEEIGYDRAVRDHISKLQNRM